MTGVYIDSHVWIHSDNNIFTGLPMKPEKNSFNRIMNAAPVLIATRILLSVNKFSLLPE